MPTGCLDSETRATHAAAARPGACRATAPAHAFLTFPHDPAVTRASRKARRLLVLINLEAANVRRARMTAQLNGQGLAFERLGHDFRGLERGEIGRWYAAHFPSIGPAPYALSGAELGCWASHLSAWARIRASGAAAGAVLEDDLLLSPDFGACVRELENGLRGFDLVYLGTSSRNLSRWRVTMAGPLKVHAPVGLVLNTWGYVVSSRWIERLLACRSIVLTIPVDHFLGGRCRGTPRPRVGVLQPACVHEDRRTARDSQIQPHTWRPDRLRLVEGARRRFLESRAGDLYYRIYRWL